MRTDDTVALTGLNNAVWKPVLGLIIDEGTGASMAPLEVRCGWIVGFFC